MSTAVDGLQQRFLEISEPDTDGVYRDGPQRRARRTDLAVRALRELWTQACEDVPFDVPREGIGLAAVGSLARGQIGPCSDLDLVIVHDVHILDQEQLAAFASKLWYPLWDCGLGLDQSVRTRQQCEDITDKDLPAVVGWLDMTPIAGDVDYLAGTATEILARWRKAARQRLPELLGSASERLERSGRLAYLNQPDVKESRGGLRDTTLISALAASWLADRPHGRYDQAGERLLDIRDCLHLAARKDTDILLAAYQPRVAALLGLDDPTLPRNERDVKAIDDLQTMLARLGRAIAFSWESTAARASHTLTHDKPRFAFFQVFTPRFGGRREAPTFEILAPGVAQHEREVVLAPSVKPQTDAELPLRVAVAAAEYGLPINALTLRNLGRCPITDRDWSASMRALLIRLLASGSALTDVWEELDSVDIPGRWIPEWLAIRNRPSASSAHRFTIDRHMIEVVSRLGRRSQHGHGYDDEEYAILLLAGLLHDIGKRPGVDDHAREGARHVPVILERMGFAPRVVDRVALLVREHLSLSRLAGTCDPNDIASAGKLAARLDHDPVLLDMLLDLTKADGSSLGATAGETITKHYGWSQWRERLVVTMADTVRAAMRR